MKTGADEAVLGGVEDTIAPGSLSFGSKFWHNAAANKNE